MKRSVVPLCALLVLMLVSSGCSKDSVPNSPSDLPVGAAAVDPGNPQQLIRGFGGVNMPGWISDMSPGMASNAFGTGDGQIGLSILRIRVPYDSSKFNLEVPTAQLAKSLGVETIFASPWTPPAWMKSNNNIVGGTLPDSSYAAYAAHLRSFAYTMASQGVSLYAVSLQNEPDASVNYESCTWSAAQMLNFVRDFGPLIGTRIMMPESMNFNHALSDPALNDPVAVNNVSIIGGHIYGGGLVSYPLAVSKGKEVWMTEHLDTDTDWLAVLATAKEIHDCMVANMNAYVWWYIRRFYGPIDDDGNVTKRGYYMSQYARFVRPGFFRVTATPNPQFGVNVTAYKSDSSLVIVAMNLGTSALDQLFVISGGSYRSFTPYTTSNTRDCARLASVDVNDRRFTYSLESHSVTTFVSD